MDSNDKSSTQSSMEDNSERTPIDNNHSLKNESGMTTSSDSHNTRSGSAVNIVVEHVTDTEEKSSSIATDDSKNKKGLIEQVAPSGDPLIEVQATSNMPPRIFIKQKRPIEYKTYLVDEALAKQMISLIKITEKKKNKETPSASPINTILTEEKNNKEASNPSDIDTTLITSEIVKHGYYFFCDSKNSQAGVIIINNPQIAYYNENEAINSERFFYRVANLEEQTTFFGNDFETLNDNVIPKDLSTALITKVNDIAEKPMRISISARYDLMQQRKTGTNPNTPLTLLNTPTTSQTNTPKLPLTSRFNIFAPDGFPEVVFPKEEEKKTGSDDHATQQDEPVAIPQTNLPITVPSYSQQTNVMFPPIEEEKMDRTEHIAHHQEATEQQEVVSNQKSWRCCLIL